MRFNVLVVIILVAVVFLGATFNRVEFVQAKASFDGKSEARVIVIKDVLPDFGYGYLLNDRAYAGVDGFLLSYDELSAIAKEVYQSVKSKSVASEIEEVIFSPSNGKLRATVKVNTFINLNSLYAKLLRIKSNPLSVYVDYDIRIEDDIVKAKATVRSNEIRISDRLAKIALRTVFENDKGVTNLESMLERVMNNVGRPIRFAENGVEYESFKE